MNCALPVLLYFVVPWAYAIRPYIFHDFVFALPWARCIVPLHSHPNPLPLRGRGEHQGIKKYIFDMKSSIFCLSILYRLLEYNAITLIIRDTCLYSFQFCVICLEFRNKKILKQAMIASCTLYAYFRIYVTIFPKNQESKYFVNSASIEPSL